ncbi:MAG TPA: hypothetical protein V6C78_21085 [Crinalium sp.]|jgi:hypothetical protein
MTELLKDSVAVQAAELLDYYSFDLSGYDAVELVHRWLLEHPAIWVRAAVVEALYQGRYKAISVEQILVLWHRRGHPIHHFNHEFERIICGKFSQIHSAPIYFPSSEPSVESTSTRPTAFAIEPVSVPSAGTQPPELQPTSHQNADITVSENPNASIPAREEPEHAIPSDAARRDLQPTVKSPASNVHSSTKFSEFAAVSESRLGDHAIQPFKPQSDLETVHVEQAEWSRTETTRYPIHQFIPTVDSPDFYTKLKAVARLDESLSDENTSANIAFFK